MKNIDNNELKNVKGGAGNTIWIIFGGVCLLLLGIIDGYHNPLKCNNE